MGDKSKSIDGAEEPFCNLIEQFRLPLGEGDRRVSAGPNASWALEAAYLNALAAVLYLSKAPSDSWRPSRPSRALRPRDDLRAIGRLYGSLLSQFGAPVPIVVLLTVDSEEWRTEVQRWLLDASWHNGEAIFYLIPPDDLKPSDDPKPSDELVPPGNICKFIYNLLIPEVENVDHVRSMADARFLDIMKECLERADRTGSGWPDPSGMAAPGSDGVSGGSLRESFFEAIESIPSQAAAGLAPAAVMNLALEDWMEHRMRANGLGTE